MKLSENKVNKVIGAFIVIMLLGLVGLSMVRSIPDPDVYDPNNTLLCTYCKGIGCKECDQTGSSVLGKED